MLTGLRRLRTGQSLGLAQRPRRVATVSSLQTAEFDPEANRLIKGHGPEVHPGSPPIAVVALDKQSIHSGAARVAAIELRPDSRQSRLGAFVRQGKTYGRTPVYH